MQHRVLILLGGRKEFMGTGVIGIQTMKKKDVLETEI